MRLPRFPRIGCADGAVKKQAALDNANKVTREQIEEFLEICRVKYLRAKIEPGQLIEQRLGCDLMYRFDRRSCWSAIYR